MAGRRNLALVGSHRDYLADMVDDRTGESPSCVMGCASPEDAATSYFRNVFENSGGAVRRAVVAVWLREEGSSFRTVFEVTAALTPCSGADAEAGEFDVVLHAREKR